MADRPTLVRRAVAGRVGGPRWAPSA